MLRAMTEHDEIWLPLVDEPIGSIVAQLQADDPEIDRLVGSPRRILAFRTFAYIRVGMKLGELLVEHDVPPYDGSESWVELLLRDRIRGDLDEIKPGLLGLGQCDLDFSRPVIVAGLVDQLDFANTDLLVDARAVLLDGRRGSHRATNGSALLGCCNGSANADPQRSG